MTARTTADLQVKVLKLLSEGPMSKANMKERMWRKATGTDQVLESTLRVLVQTGKIVYVNKQWHLKT